MKHVPLILILIPLALSATVLGACSSDDDSTDEPSSVGGIASCDEATMTAAVKDLFEAEPELGEFQALDAFDCADGWAVTFPVVIDTSGTEYAYTQVFEAEGQFWIPVTDRTAVCGTIDSDDPTAYPADAQVPKDLWDDACNTN